MPWPCGRAGRCRRPATRARKQASHSLVGARAEADAVTVGARAGAPRPHRRAGEPPLRACEEVPSPPSVGPGELLPWPHRRVSRSSSAAPTVDVVVPLPVFVVQRARRGWSSRGRGWPARSLERSSRRRGAWKPPARSSSGPRRCPRATEPLPVAEHRGAGGSYWSCTDGRPWRRGRSAAGGSHLHARMAMASCHISTRSQRREVWT